MAILVHLKGELQSMGLKVLGPLISWTLIFAIGILIKVVAFKDTTVWFEIAPEATLWATGILFTIAAADSVFSQARLFAKYTRKTSGIGYEIDYEVSLPETYEPTAHSKYLYLFLFGLATWILNVFLSGLIVNTVSSWQPSPSSPGSTSPSPLAGIDFGVIILFLISMAIASGTVVIAVRALREVSK